VSVTLSQELLERSRERLRVHAQYDRDVVERAEVVVVGSGPAGAVVAYELASAGKDVILLEEGPPFIPSEFELDASRSMARTMREGGLRATRGTVVPTMQARCLGGGSLVNSAICVRPPEFVFERWRSGFELESLSRSELDPHFEQVEAFLGIAPTPDSVQGARNLLFRRGCDQLGYSSEPISRNVVGCRGSGECFTGCRNRAKQSMDISYVPAALRAGARVWTSVQVQKIAVEGRRAVAIEGRVAQPLSTALGHKVRVEASTIVLAAGCMATPVLLKKSGNLANGSGQVGRNLQFHPGVAVSGIFPERVDPQFGATQGYQSLHFLQEGFKLETLWAPPAVMTLRMPGFGHDLLRRFAEVPQMAVFDAIGSCNRSVGEVRTRFASMDPALTYRMDPEDTKILTRALWVMAQIFFAAGAKKIGPGVLHGVPTELHSLEEAEVLRTRDIRARDLVLGGNHAFCTTRMHRDATRGVVDEIGRCHEFDNLYIADTGIFPQCPSVNPMLTAMALARRQALELAERI